MSFAADNGSVLSSASSAATSGSNTSCESSFGSCHGSSERSYSDEPSSASAMSTGGSGSGSGSSQRGRPAKMTERTYLAKAGRGSSSKGSSSEKSCLTDVAVEAAEKEATRLREELERFRAEVRRRKLASA